MLQTQLTNEQVFDLQATFTTALGNPAVVTDVTWANSDAAVVSLAVDPADPSKVLISAQAPGTAVLTVEAKTASGSARRNQLGEQRLTVHHSDSD